MNVFFSAFLFLILTFQHSVKAEDKKCYEIKLGDSVVACVYEGVGSISAFERASTIERRLKTLATDYSVQLSDIQVADNDQLTIILAKDNAIMSLSDKDVNPKEYASSQAMAQAVVENIKSAMIIYRDQHSSQSILAGALYTILATLGLILAFFLLKKLAKGLNSLLYSFSEKFLSNVKIKSYQIFNVNRVNKIFSALVTVFKTVTIFFLIYFYISLILSFFPWTAKIAPKVLGYIIDPLYVVVTLILNYIPNIFFIIVIVFITHYILKVVKVIFNEIENGNISFNSFHKDWALPTFKLVRVLICAIALVMIFPYLPGSSSPAFQGLSVFLGVLISFSSGSAIGNIIAGIVLTYMRPFKPGDRVKIADTVGDIVEKNFLVTRVKTIKNTDITIPNAMVLGSHIINYSSSAAEKGLILNTTITIGYETPWPQVHEMLKEAGRRTNLVDQNKEAFVFQTALNDFHVSYELNVYTQFANDMAKIYSDLHQNIQDAFNEKGIEIMSPQYQSIRDGNETTLPKGYRKDNYLTPSFRINSNNNEN